MSRICARAPGLAAPLSTAARAALFKAPRVWGVLCTGSLSKRGCTSAPKMRTVSSAVACGWVEARTPKMI